MNSIIKKNKKYMNDYVKKQRLISSVKNYLPEYILL